jgi:hypothetical protein
MSAATVASYVGIAAGVNSLTGGGVSKLFGGQGQQSGASATATANPMAPYQAQLAQMYQGYLQPGASSNIQAMPGFTQYKTGVLDPAMQASQAKAASTGQLYSGAESAQLQQIGQQGYSGFMQNYMSNLYSGATGGALAGQQAGNTVNTANQQAFQQGLGSLATGLQGYAGNPNVGSGYNLNAPGGVQNYFQGGTNPGSVISDFPAEGAPTSPII